MPVNLTDKKQGGVSCGSRAEVKREGAQDVSGVYPVGCGHVGRERVYCGGGVCGERGYTVQMGVRGERWVCSLS